MKKIGSYCELFPHSFKPWYTIAHRLFLNPQFKTNSCLNGTECLSVHVSTTHYRHDINGGLGWWNVLFIWQVSRTWNNSPILYSVQVMWRLLIASAVPAVTISPSLPLPLHSVVTLHPEHNVCRFHAHSARRVHWDQTIYSRLSLASSGRGFRDWSGFAIVRSLRTILHFLSKPQLLAWQTSLIYLASTWKMQSPPELKFHRTLWPHGDTINTMDSNSPCSLIDLVFLWVHFIAMLSHMAKL